MQAKQHPLREYFNRKDSKPLSKVARDADCSRQTLYRVMNGDTGITLSLLARISAQTGVPLSELAGATAREAAE